MPAETTVTPAPVREPDHVVGRPTAPHTPADAGPAPRARGEERPIFASADGRRARRLRIVALVVAGLTALWLIALVAGILGFGRLPVVPDLRPSTGGGQAAPHWKPPASAPAAASSSAASAARARAAARRARRSAAARRQGSSASSRSRTTPRRATRTPAATRRAQGGTPAGAPVSANGRRVGQTGVAPPTSSRPATPPGQTRKTALTGSATTTTDTTASHGLGATHRASATG